MKVEVKGEMVTVTFGKQELEGLNLDSDWAEFILSRIIRELRKAGWATGG